VNQTTVAYLSPEVHLQMESAETTCNWRMTGVLPYNRRFNFLLDGDRSRQTFTVAFTASPYARGPLSGIGPHMMTQAMIEFGLTISVYGEPYHSYAMSWKNVMYREHWLMDGEDKVVLDLRAPSKQELELFRLQKKFEECSYA